VVYDGILEQMNEALTSKALEYLGAFEELAKRYTPDIIDTSLIIIQITCLSNLLIALVAICVAVGLFKVFLWNAQENKKVPQIYGTDKYICGMVFSGCGCGIAGLFGLTIFNIWYWVGVFNPKLYIAYKIFAKVL